MHLRDDADKVLNKERTRFNPKNKEIEIPFKIGHSLLHIDMKSTDEDIDLAGLVLERTQKTSQG